MESKRPRARRVVVVKAAKTAFWTALAAGVITAVFGFPTFLILGEAPLVGYDGLFAFVACLFVFPQVAAISGVVWGVVSAVRRPPRLRPWLIAGAVGIVLGLALAVVTLFSGSEAAWGLAMLCWLALAAVVVPAASAARVHAWLESRGGRGVR